ncbi:MAG: nuclear transport factor 2 family protein [Clostridiaceae bacterium]
MEDYKNVIGYICDVQCNSPRAEFIREFNSWFMGEQQLDRIISVMDDDIVWEMVGDMTIEGAAEVRALQAEASKTMGLIEQRVDGIVCDGSYGISFGTSIMTDGNSYAFVDIIQFKDSEDIKIEKIKTFMSKLES